MGATRSLPFTEFPPRDDVIATIQNKYTLAVEPFDVSVIQIKGGHHEGLLQVRQPWIWGLSDEQKRALYNDLGTIVRYAFIDELLKRNQRVVVFEGKLPKWASDYMITGSITSVELNTYGQGTLEGFGSAGNYWEAEIVLTDIAIVHVSDGKTVWRGDLTKYCKLEGSPVKLDWTIFTVIANSLKEGTTLSKGVSSEHVGQILENSEADYILEPSQQNPVEIAARLAALDVLKLIYRPRTGNGEQTNAR